MQKKLKQSSALSSNDDTLPTAVDEIYSNTNEDKNVKKEYATEAALRHLRRAASKGQIIYSQCIPKRPAQYAKSTYIPQKLTRLLKRQGIVKLYSHQVAAVDQVLEGSSIVAATPTASGKSLMYTVPVLEALMSNPKSRALFIFPLKALAQDQLKSLRNFLSPIRKTEQCYCYDGDTAVEDRAHIRKHAHILITNPDMLHQGILPNHKQWSQFFSNLNFVVLDEAHVYRGIFGSHVGCILRRLMRIARHYKAEPMFISCSATIANPQEHVMQLTSTNVEVVRGSGAPSGEKHIICWQPPELDSKNVRGDATRKSPYQEAADIVVELMTAGVQTLCFVEARKLTEILTSIIHDKLKKKNLNHLVDKVDSYRAGYNSMERRKLEMDLRSGALQALITTNALELGIDVGALDATVHVGVPSSVSSLWQQIGRSGRRQLPSLAVIVAMERPLDQFYMHFPEKLFEKEAESAYIHPANPYLLRLHLPCAARELPLTEADGDLFGGAAFEAVRDELAEEAALIYEQGPKGDQYRYRWADSPAVSVPIRGTSRNPFLLFDEQGKLIEEIDSKMAFRQIHAGAVYHHRRETYEVLRLDVDQRRAIARICNSSFTTDVKESIDIIILEVRRRSTVLASSAAWGKVKVQERVSSYAKKNLLTEAIVAEDQLQLPPIEFDTIGMWWDIPLNVWQRLERDGALYGALVAVKRVISALVPSFSMCDRVDINGLATAIHEQTGCPQIFIYDAHPGGVGIAQQTFLRLGTLWKDAYRLVQACSCMGGCPACIQGCKFDRADPDEITEKQACLSLLEGLIGERTAEAPNGNLLNEGPNLVSHEAHNASDKYKDTKSPTAIEEASLWNDPQTSNNLSGEGVQQLEFPRTSFEGQRVASHFDTCEEHGGTNSLPSRSVRLKVTPALLAVDETFISAKRKQTEQGIAEACEPYRTADSKSAGAGYGGSRQAIGAPSLNWTSKQVTAFSQENPFGNFALDALKRPSEKRR